MNKKTLRNPCFKVDAEEAYRPGVYKIENRDYIYIGSTRVSLAGRFLQHYHNEGGSHSKTYNVLHNYGDFTCLESFGYCDIEDVDEQDLRDCEAKYIWLFKNNTDKIFLNEILPENFSKKKDKDYQTIKIPNCLYENAVKCLYDNGYLILKNTMYDKKFDPLNSIDDMAHVYGQMGFFDYMEFGDILKYKEYEKVDCETISLNIDKKLNHVWLNIDINGEKKKIDILEDILSYIGFTYYRPFEILEVLKKLMPRTIVLDKINDTSYKLNEEKNEWFVAAYNELCKNYSFVNNGDSSMGS